MIGVLLAAAGAVLSVLAFPPIGPGWLIVPGVSLFLLGLRGCSGRRHGLLLGAIYGVGFFAGLMWWLSELGLIASVPLILVQGAFLALFGWWIGGKNDRPAIVWQLFVVGAWAGMELVRYHFPVGGLEWGAAGYALSDQGWGRALAANVGTTGLTVLVVMLASGLALAARRELSRWLLIPLPLTLAAALLLGLAGAGVVPGDPGSGGPVVIVQGSTPCPFEHCSPDERLRTFNQHLELTRTIDDAWLVIWSEGSTGSSNADPVNNPEIGDLIGEEARRLHSWFLVGSDRPVNTTHWVNANVLFNPEGEIVGEYRKQHAVPFGEYIPWRPLFEWIPALDAVPRDMIPGEGPVVFDLDGANLGSVISFEGGFSRYARRHVIEGATFIVVATNEGSYGTTPASDQFIGMTRMRAAELGVPVAHSAVTGKSVFFDRTGAFSSVETGLGTIEVISNDLGPAAPTPYVRYGDWLMWSAVGVAVLCWWLARRLVGSSDPVIEEE